MNAEFARRSVYSGFALSTVLIASAVNAQTADSTHSSATVEEIVVTATRQERAISRVPISIQAYSQEQIDVMGIKEIDDISRVTPGVTFYRAGSLGGATIISMRGVEAQAGTSAIGVYIDDTPINARSMNSTTTYFPQLFDVERVEVLQGPQGTLFGSGSESGTIRFISTQPSLHTYSGYSKAEVNTVENGSMGYEAGAAFGGPLVEDKLGFRVSAWHREQGGWTDHVSPADPDVVTDKDMNTVGYTAFRGALTWAPTDSLTLTPSVTYQRDRYHDQSNYWEDISDPGNGDFRNANVLRSGQEDGYTLSALVAKWTGPGFNIVSNTSYFDRSAEQGNDFSQQTSALLVGNPFTTVPSPGSYDVSQEQWVQEVRIENADPDARLNWVGGLFYSESKQRDFQRVSGSGAITVIRQALGIPDSFSDQDVLGLVFSGYPVLADGNSYLDDMRSTDEQLAAFAQFDYRLRPTVTLTAGIRFSDNNYKFNEVRDGFYAGGRIETQGKGDESPITPKAGISWQPDAESLYYLTASKGFRMGGAAAAPPDYCASDLAALGYDSAPSSFGPDSLWNYEIGAKNRMLDGRFQTAVSAYVIDRKDTQGFLRLPNCGFSFPTNLGDARSAGFDLVAQMRLADALSLYASAGYVDSKYTEDVSNGVSLITRDGEVMRVSPWSASISAQYDFAAFGNRQAYVRTQYDYKARFEDARPYQPNSDPTIPPYGEISTFSARVGMAMGNWDLSLFADNLANATPELSRVRESGTSLYYNNTLQPRTIGLTATFRY